MGTNRILLSATRVAMSRPGFDVLTAPITPAYLAMDSSFGVPERPLVFGFVFGVSSGQLFTPSWPTTYPAPPGVLLQTLVGGTTYYENYRYTNNAGISNYFTPFYPISGVSTWGIRSNGDGNDGWYQIARNWVYSAWRTW